MGRQINAGVLYLINEVELSIYRFLTSGAKKNKKQPQPIELGVDIDREGGHLNREGRLLEERECFYTLRPDLDWAKGTG